MINHAEQDIREAVRSWSNRRGVDVVVEHVGEATWEASVASLARNGRLVTCGTTTGANGPLNLWSLFAKQNQIIGAYGGTRGELRTVLDLVARGELRAVIDRIETLDHLAEAQRHLEAREQFGKIVISVDGT